MPYEAKAVFGYRKCLDCEVDYDLSITNAAHAHRLKCQGNPTWKWELNGTAPSLSLARIVNNLPYLRAYDGLTNGILHTIVLPYD
jgi:hypothetical protein